MTSEIVARKAVSAFTERKRRSKYGITTRNRVKTWLGKAKRKGKKRFYQAKTSLSKAKKRFCRAKTALAKAKMRLPSQRFHF